MTDSLLLIDDIPDSLNDLRVALEGRLDVSQLDIRTWSPSHDDQMPKEKFDSLVDGETILVVTDYDLTQGGVTGLFGPTIVDWCQAAGIPVGDFSRVVRTLPKEPNLFEIRVPQGIEAAADYISAVFHGFRTIRNEFERRPELLEGKRGPAGVLAGLLGRPQEESQFGQYGRTGMPNAAVAEQLTPIEGELTLDAATKRKVIAYVVGHLLLNGVLRFPGPILSKRALASFLAINPIELESGDLKALFSSCAYDGPFAQLEAFYWYTDVMNIIDDLTPLVPSDFRAEMSSELSRKAVEIKLDRTLLRSTCERCHGQFGGFWCPFKDKTVCERPDCSVSSNGWVPPGARLCRTDKTFYDEWAPILGF